MLKGRMSHITKVWDHYGLYRQCIFLALGLVALIGLACSSARAQEGRSMGPPPDNVDAQVAFLTEKLMLSPEQEAKVRPVIEGVSEKRHALFQEYRWKGKDAQNELSNDLKSLLVIFIQVHTGIIFFCAFRTNTMAKFSIGMFMDI